MEHPIPEEITTFVRKHSFDYAEYLGVWKGYEVYTQDSTPLMRMVV